VLALRTIISSYESTFASEKFEKVICLQRHITAYKSRWFATNRALYLCLQEYAQ